jgi:hypothetical protein
MTFCIAMATCLSASMLAQTPASGRPAALTMIIGFPTLREVPMRSGLAQRFTQRWGSVTGKGATDTRHYLVDDAHHVYFGYELAFEEQPQKGEYLATFRILALTAMELSMQKMQGRWTSQALPAIPAPRVVHAGDMLSIDLFVDPATGAKLIDDIRVQARSVGIPPPPVVTIK